MRLLSVGSNFKSSRMDGANLLPSSSDGQCQLFFPVCVWESLGMRVGQCNMTSQLASSQGLYQCPVLSVYSLERYLETGQWQRPGCKADS